MSIIKYVQHTVYQDLSITTFIFVLNLIRYIL